MVENLPIKVSIIVTTFNRKVELQKTIESILNQTHRDIEVIVVDNFSDYDFMGFIKLFNDERLSGYQNHNHGIIAINRNYAINKASSNYLAFCDDDDIWHIEKLEKQLRYIYKNNFENKDVVIYTNCINRYSETKGTPTNKKKLNSINDLILGNQITFSSVLASNFSNKIRFNELPEFLAVEDYLLWCSLMTKGYSFHLIDDILVEYTVTESSASMINYGSNHLKSILVATFISNGKNNDLINTYILFFSILKHLIKFSIKTIIKNWRY